MSSELLLLEYKPRELTSYDVQLQYAYKRIFDMAPLGIDHFSQDYKAREKSFLTPLSEYDKTIDELFLVQQELPCQQTIYNDFSGEKKLAFAILEQTINDLKWMTNRGSLPPQMNRCELRDLIQDIESGTFEIWSDLVGIDFQAIREKFQSFLPIIRSILAKKEIRNGS